MKFFLSNLSIYSDTKITLIFLNNFFTEKLEPTEAILKSKSFQQSVEKENLETNALQVNRLEFLSPIMEEKPEKPFYIS